MDIDDGNIPVGKLPTDQPIDKSFTRSRSSGFFCRND
jgi:hypothetical protein